MTKRKMGLRRYKNIGMPYEGKANTEEYVRHGWSLGEDIEGTKQWASKLGHAIGKTSF